MLKKDDFANDEDDEKNPEKLPIIISATSSTTL